MSTALDLEVDFDLLTSEMEAPPCESPHHNAPRTSHDDGEATHYMLIGHECYGPVGQIIAVCASYARYWGRDARYLSCVWCGSGLTREMQNKVLGPIAGQ